MLGTFRLPVAALAVFAFAGCGTSADDAPVSKGAAPSTAPKSAGPMVVAATDGRVGDATTASSGSGLTELKVSRRPTSPDVLRQGVGAGASCPDVEILPSAENLPAVAAATVCLVNGERADAGLPPLTASPKLDAASVGHSTDMVAKGYFAHDSQNGANVEDRAREAGYIPASGQWTVGENLAWGIGTLATPKGIVQAWMESQGHRDNILRSGFREAGLGVVLGNPRTTDGQGATYTMNFGSISGGSQNLSVSQSQRAISVPGASEGGPRRSAERRSAAARRRKACRMKAKKARASVRKARMARCGRASRSRR